MGKKREERNSSRQGTWMGERQRADWRLFGSSGERGAWRARGDGDVTGAFEFYQWRKIMDELTKRQSNNIYPFYIFP